MEAREELSNANDEKMRAIKVANAENIMICIADIKNQLSDKKFDAAAQSAIRLRYLEKLKQEIG